MAGFNWTYLGSSIDTMPSIVVGPYNTPGTYYYIATYTNQCGTFTDTATIIASNSVPVKLVSITADKQNDDVVIQWTTASELNNNYFEVQRSIDGIHFEETGMVAGNGTTLLTSHYEYTDVNAFADFATIKTLFYRLKQVDLDGTFELSKTVSVNVDRATIKNLDVFPNPNQGKFSLSIESQETTTSTIKIYNVIGHEVFSTQAKLNIGQNTIEVESALPQGVYLMLVSDQGVNRVKRFVISK
jgi:hypothetical protein